jgi:hypothetical protein
MSKKNNSVLDKLIPLGTIQRRQRQKKESKLKNWQTIFKLKIRLFFYLVEEMKIEGLNAIQALHDLNLDPDSYELSKLIYLVNYFKNK